jgi:hypothetical protein
MAEIMDNANIKARIERTVKSVQNDGWEYQFQGLAVTEELKNLLTQVSSVMPNVKFHPFDDMSVNYNFLCKESNSMQFKQIFVVSDWFVYMDDFPYEIGRISYRDHSAKRDGKELTYGIYSRKIQNAKYHSGRDQHNMMMSKDLSKAIKLAKTYLTPYSTYELATASYEGMHQRTCKALEDTARGMRVAIEPIRNETNTLIAEMMHLIKQGTQFSTEGFKLVANQLEAKVMAYKAEEERKVGALFVRLYNIGEDTYADVQEASNIRHNAFAGKGLNGSSTLTYKMSDMPEDVAHAVASLSILERDQYVTGVGMKVDERHFWVERG